LQIELHCHSTLSDGSVPPEEVAARAAARDVELFCLTDHDTSAGYEATRAVLGDERTMRGVELSCSENKRTVHVLIYDVAHDDRWQILVDRMVEAQEARRGRVHAIAERLARLKIHIDADAIIENAEGDTIGRPHVARAMVEAGVVSSMNEAFTRYLHDGGPGDVVLERLSVAEGLELGRAVGAKMSLAHPHVYGTKEAAALLRRHREGGLEAIEGFYGGYSTKERKKWLRLAKEERLIVTGGSDFHGEAMPKIEEPVVNMPEQFAHRLVGWLERS
jgi:hypothetical protein